MLNGAIPFEFDAAGRSFGHFLSEPPPRGGACRFGPTQTYLLANRSGAAEVATKTVSSWSNALDKPGLFEINAPNDDQCGLFDVGAPSHDQRGPFDAQDDNQCALKESAVASLEAFKLADPVRIDTFALPLL